jgi:hypothetical protein
MRRWREDIVLVEEEMRCTIEYGYWSAGTWATREEGRAGTVEAELQEDLAAYAREQQWREIETCDKLKQKWAGVRAKGHAYLAKETAPGVDVVVVDLDDDNY